MYLPKNYYTNHDSAKDEYDKIFKKSWLFAGLTTELAKHNDYITFEIFGHSIVVQNFNGTLAAFQNVCAHRFNKIQTGSKGNRALFCQYHGWVYNNEGKPIGIPKRETFNADELSGTRLTQYLVDTCGKFVFVKIDKEEKTTLADFLSDFYDYLADMSQHIDKEAFYGNIPHEANWKLLIENVLEGYHCPLLHAESLVKAGFCITSTAPQFSGKHSKWSSPKVENELNDLSDKRLSFLQSRSLKHDSYMHLHIYPTFLFASTEGYFFYVGNILPVDAEKCVLMARYYAPVLSNNTKPFLQKAFFDSSAETGIKIMRDEDKPIIEQCQKGLKQAPDYPGLLSTTEEIRIIKFHETYLNDMNNV